MASELFLCISQDEINTPYQFKETGINIFSMEEAAYHCYHYWKQSYDEFACAEFLEWTKETLGLPFLASKIMVIDQIESAKDKLIAFLNIFGYFDEIQMATLKTQLIEWEKRLEWERQKERGDYLVKKGDYARAVLYYKRALENEENPQLLNNLAIAYMALSLFQEATTQLEQAVAQAPTNVQMLLNLAEASIFNHQFEKAVRVLNDAEALDSSHPDIQYLYGELNLETGNTRYSIDYLEKAIALNPEPHYIYRLTDVYVKLRKYDKAMQNLDMIKNKDKTYLTKLAALYYETGNVPAAVKSVEKALLTNPNDITLWIKLAMYHRLDYDVTRANGAIAKALTLDPNNEKAMLEQARIKKAMGKTKEYQSLLHGILSGFKSRYRETTPQ